MAVYKTYVNLTTEGTGAIYNYLAKSTDFSVDTFRLGWNGSAVTYTSKMTYFYDSIAQPELYNACVLLNAYSLSYTAGDFTTDHPLVSGVPDKVVILSDRGIGDSNGFIPILTKDVSTTSIEFECYIPPVTGLTFTANEIMIYQDNGTSFIYGIFPDITKNPNYGINFKIVLKL